MRLGLIFSACMLAGCQVGRPADARRAEPDAAAWAGVYVSGDGRGDRPALLLSIRWITLAGEREPRPVYHLNAELGPAARIDVIGAARIDGDRLTFAIASAGVDDDGDSRAIATIERYVLRRSPGGRIALVREELLEAGPRQGSLEGVLVKIADDAAGLDVDAAPEAAVIAR